MFRILRARLGFLTFATPKFLAGQRLQSCPFSKHAGKKTEKLDSDVLFQSFFFGRGGNYKKLDVLQKPVLFKNKKRKLFARLGKKLGSPSQSWEVGKFQPQIFPPPALFVCCKNKNSSGFPHIELNTKLLWTPFLQDLLALLHLHLPFGRRSSNKQTKKETSRSQWVHQKDHCSLVCRMPVVFKFKSERLMEGSPTPKNNWIPSSWWLSVLKSWGWPTRSSHNKKIHQRRSMKGPQQKKHPLQKHKDVKM